MIGSYAKRTNIFQVRLSTPELEKLKVKASEKGFDTLSDFFRNSVFCYDTAIEQKIIETHKMMSKVLEILEKKE